jgi:hypothetical protein
MSCSMRRAEAGPTQANYFHLQIDGARVSVPWAAPRRELVGARQLLAVDACRLTPDHPLRQRLDCWTTEGVALIGELSDRDPVRLFDEAEIVREVASFKLTLERS